MARTVQLTRAGLLACALSLSCGPRPLPDPGPLPAGKSFAGVWDSNWGQLELYHQGTHVHGTYEGSREGSLSGRQEGDLFIFKWTQFRSPFLGRGWLRMSPDGEKLEGRWGYMRSYDDGGRWWATRSRDLVE